MRNQENSWNEGDLKSFMDTYWKSDSLSFIGKSGINYGWQTTLENYQKSYKNKSEMGTLSFDNISITQLSLKYIYVIGKWHLNRLKPLKDLSGHYTLIWQKIDGEWVIVSDHSS
jgi:ketosteroid isomerase-like protein